METFNLDNTDIDNRPKFNMLTNYGENLTAKEYITDPAISRDNEIKEIILSLLIPEKGAILVGKAGIGKTAIVEGLAYRIKNKLVPNALIGWEVYKISMTSLMGSTGENNDNRVEVLIQELKNRDKTIIFIDEVHLLINRSADNSRPIFSYKGEIIMRIYLAGPIFFYGDYLRNIEWATKIREKFPDVYLYSPVENTDINGVEGKKKFAGS